MTLTAWIMICKLPCKVLCISPLGNTIFLTGKWMFKLGCNDNKNHGKHHPENTNKDRGRFRNPYQEMVLKNNELIKVFYKLP